VQHRASDSSELVDTEEDAVGSSVLSNSMTVEEIAAGTASLSGAVAKDLRLVRHGDDVVVLVVFVFVIEM
jgi:hypothetical protein